MFKMIDKETKNNETKSKPIVKMDISNTTKVSYSDYMQLEQDLQTNIEHGLLVNDALQRQKLYGYNEFDVGEEDPLWKKYLNQFKEPMILLLLCSGIVSICMGQYDDAMSITVAVLIVVTVAFVQEYRSDKSVEAITKLVPPTCHCLRSGEWMDFLAKDLVVGDVVQLNAGDRVPADIRLFEANHLEIDESSFTGEIEPVRKHTKVLDSSNGNQKGNVVWMGTLVRSGNGKGIVYATGISSEFGSIFQMMKEEEPPKTPLQKSMDQLGKQLSCYSIIIIGLVVLFGWTQHRKILEMLTIGVSLAVAAIPEGLPIVVTVTLALGVMRMAGQNAIVRRLPVVETLGCATVICSDKTGTLTKNEMTVTDIILASGRKVEVTGVGYHGHGEILLEGQSVTEITDIALTMLIKTGCICNNATVKAGQLFGQATDGAIITLGLKLGLVRINDEYERLEEIPFTSEKKFMAVKCRQRWSSDQTEKVLYHVKGAPEKILKMCTNYQGGNSVFPLTKDKVEKITETVDNLGGQGLRVIALCRGSMLGDMTYLGLVGIIDPPRDGVRVAMKTLQESGVEVKMVTGDARETATGICKKIGLSYEPKRLLSGAQLESMDYLELKRIINDISVFYRVTPKDKVTIVKALQECNHVVAMTGDGVNDAVALKRADIGIAMGKCGTDVSKEAADMILADDHFGTILSALAEGKGIYYNIKNFVCFQLSTSIAAISLITISTFLGLQNPLNAMQILWINIIMDGPPAQSLGVEPVDEDIMKRKPRAVKSPMIDRYLLMRVLTSAVIIVLGTLFIFWREMSDNKVTPRDTTMTFTCFVFFDMFNALSCRSQKKSILEIGFCTNHMFLYAVLGSLVGQMLVIYFPPLQSVFQTESLYMVDIISLVCLASSVFVVDEVRKLCIRFMSRRRSVYRKLSASGADLI